MGSGRGRSGRPSQGRAKLVTAVAMLILCGRIHGIVIGGIFVGRSTMSILFSRAYSPRFCSISVGAHARTSSWDASRPSRPVDHQREAFERNRLNFQRAEE